MTRCGLGGGENARGLKRDSSGRHGLEKMEAAASAFPSQPPQLEVVSEAVAVAEAEADNNKKWGDLQQSFMLQRRWVYKKRLAQLWKVCAKYGLLFQQQQQQPAPTTPTTKSGRVGKGEGNSLSKETLDSNILMCTHHKVSRNIMRPGVICKENK